MNRWQIKCTLESKGISMRSVARGLGVSAAAVSSVAAKKFFSPRIMAAIADAMGIPKEIVFPEFYLSHTKTRKKTQVIDANEACHEPHEAVNV